jgi:hypothetical protein
MTDTNVALLHPSPAKAEGRPKIKDPTEPLRSRRARQKRKSITGAKTKTGERFRDTCKVRDFSPFRRLAPQPRP